MFLQILRSLESLAAEFALVGLEWHMNADVGGDVVALNGCDAAVSPGASQTEIVCGFAADMAFADVFLHTG